MARRFSPLRSVGVVGAGAALALFGASSAIAQDAPAPASPAAPAQPGATYTNKELGLSIEGPPSWKLVEGATTAPQWTRLASFADPDVTTGAQILVAVRRAYAFTLPKLRAEVQKTYAEDKSYTVTAVTDVPATGRRPLPGVIVDATQAKAPDAPPAPAAGTPPAAGAPAPAAALPIVMRIQALYLLGGDWEYLILAQARATRFIGIQAWVDKVFNGVS